LLWEKKRIKRSTPVLSPHTGKKETTRRIEGNLKKKGGVSARRKEFGVSIREHSKNFSTQKQFHGLAADFVRKESSRYWIQRSSHARKNYEGRLKTGKARRERTKKKQNRLTRHE